MAQGTASALKTASASGANVRIANAPIMLEDNLVGVVQVGRSLSEMQRTLRELLYLLLGGTALGLLVATGVGSFIAKRALAPVDAATRAAQGIVDAQGLSQRLDYQGPPDEIDRRGAPLCQAGAQERQCRHRCGTGQQSIGRNK